MPLEQWKKGVAGCLGFIRDGILPSHMGIISQTIRVGSLSTNQVSMECHIGSHCSLTAFTTLQVFFLTLTILTPQRPGVILRTNTHLRNTGSNFPSIGGSSMILAGEIGPLMSRPQLIRWWAWWLAEDSVSSSHPSHQLWKHKIPSFEERWHELSHARKFPLWIVRQLVFFLSWLYK